MRIGVLGVNHKLARLGLRERLASCCQKWLHSPFASQCEGAIVPLLTCNRMEIYFSSQELPITHTEILNYLREEVEEEFDQKLYTYFGSACFHHLVRVIAGLDSAIRGETEIQGQVSLAYEEAMKRHKLPMELHFLFQKGLKLGKDVRGLLPFARGMPELQDAILHLGALFFPTPRQARILFLGASSINASLINSFHKRGFKDLTLSNRTLEHAQKLSVEYDLTILPWSEKRLWTQYDWVICATKAPHFLLTPDECCYPERRQLLMDLSVPRNIDPQLGENGFSTLYHIDAIQETLAQSRVDRFTLFTEAEEWVEEATGRQVDFFYAQQQRKVLQWPDVLYKNAGR